MKYALIGLSDIAYYSKNKPVSLSDIVRRNKVPKSYMERILALLVKNRILKSIKGVKGGFIIDNRSSNLTYLRLYDIISQNPKKESVCSDIKNKRMQSILLKIDNSIEKNVKEAYKQIKLNDFIDNVRKRPKKRK